LEQKEDTKKNSLISWFVKTNSKLKSDETEITISSDDDEPDTTENLYCDATRSDQTTESINPSSNENTKSDLSTFTINKNDESPANVSSEVVSVISQEKLPNADVPSANLCNNSAISDDVATTFLPTFESDLPKSEPLLTVEAVKKQPSINKSTLPKRNYCKTKKERADAVVKLLTPFYKEGRLESKKLFKEFARRLTHLVSEDRNVTSINGKCAANSGDYVCVSTLLHDKGIIILEECDVVTCSNSSRKRSIDS